MHCKSKRRIGAGLGLSGGTHFALGRGAAAQVEVLKGPQGTLFGRNATGGVIDIKTKDPSHDFKGTASIGYGNFETFTASAYVTGGLSSNVAADLAVRYSNQGSGWGRNLYTGEDVNKEDNLAVRTKWLVTPTDEDRLILSLDYAKTKVFLSAVVANVPLAGTVWIPGSI